MTQGIYVALSGAIAQDRALDNVAHNIANASTPGFQAQRLSFSETFSSAAGSPQVTVNRAAMDPSRGNIDSTDNPLDLVVGTEGYFGVATAQGTRYTRCGNFHLNQMGTLVTTHGEPILDSQGGRITIPSGTSKVSVENDGSVLADGNAVGKVLVVGFKGGGLVAEGSHMAQGPTAGAPTVVRDPEITSGALEGSNFDIMRGMVDLVRISRAFDTISRMIANYKEIDDKTNQQLGGST